MTEIEKKENPEEPTKEECPLCQASPILMGIGAAHTACSLVVDPEKKSRCMAWVDGIDPKDIKDAEILFSGILENAGISEADKTAKTFNLGMQNAIVKRVEGLLERNEKVPDLELAAYKQIIKARGL